MKKLPLNVNYWKWIAMCCKRLTKFLWNNWAANSVFHSHVFQRWPQQSPLFHVIYGMKPLKCKFQCKSLFSLLKLIKNSLPYGPNNTLYLWPTYHCSTLSRNYFYSASKWLNVYIVLNVIKYNLGIILKILKQIFHRIKKIPKNKLNFYDIINWIWI